MALLRWNWFIDISNQKKGTNLFTVILLIRLFKYKYQQFACPCIRATSNIGGIYRQITDDISMNLSRKLTFEMILNEYSNETNLYVWQKRVYLQSECKIQRLDDSKLIKQTLSVYIEWTTYTYTPYIPCCHVARPNLIASKV